MSILESLAPHLRLVVADMDGTFLDGDQQIPPGAWELLDDLRDAGITFCPASGRQYGRLAAMFAGHDEHMPYIADNGTFIVMDGTPLAATTLDPEIVGDAITRIRNLGEQGTIGVVLSGTDGCYAEVSSSPFASEFPKYYENVEMVDDLMEVRTNIMKVAAFDFEKADSRLYPALSPLESCQVVLSAGHWVDVMPTGANKGEATRQLQHALGISGEETIAFGDYNNDVEMMQAAGLAVAMKNARPSVIEIADMVAPSNEDYGVITVLREILAARLSDNPKPTSH